MLRVSSPGLRCFRHPKQSSRTRWLTQAAPGSVSAAMWRNVARTLPDLRPGEVHTELSDKMAPSRTDGAEARRGEQVKRNSKASAAKKEKTRLAIEEQVQGFRKPNRVGPLVTPVQPVLKIYLTCRCRKRNFRSLEAQRIHIPTQDEPHKASSNEKLSVTSSTEPEGQYAVTDAERQVFVSLFGEEARLPLQRRRARHKHLRVLATTSSLGQAWTSYMALSFTQPHEKTYFIPWQYLHRLVRIISATRPPAQAHFELLLEVMSKIHETGGKVQTWEWNILIDAAGKGLRGTTKGQFKDALTVYDDFLNCRSPGASLRAGTKVSSKGSSNAGPRKPNEITLATVLHLASRTNDSQAFAHAVSLLKASGVRPDRVIYITLMERHTRTNNISGVSAVVSEMQRRGMELGLEGWTLYMWALARSDRMQQAESIFAALRGNAMTQVTDEVKAARAYLEGIDLNVPTDILPDEITYTAMVQAYAYQGHFRKALETFVDMVKALRSSSEGTKGGPVMDVDALLPVYRSIFLGFSRHSQIDVPGISPLVRDSRAIIRGAEGWSLSACERILNDWLRLPHPARPNAHTIYWALKSFDVLSGGDPHFLKSVVERLEARFELRWGGRLARFIEERVNNRLPRN